MTDYDLAAAGIDPGGKPLPLDKLNQSWKDVASALDAFCQTYPQSQLSGVAYVRQIDVELERLFDLNSARAVATKGEAWTARFAGVDAESSPQTQTAVAPWERLPAAPDPAAVKFAVYDLRLRDILTSYLSEDYDKASGLLAANGPLQPTDGPADRETLQKVGLYFLQRAIAAKKPVWKPEVIAAAKTECQKTAVKLADFYVKVIRPEKAAAIYGRILDKDPTFAPVVPTLEVYACIQIARSYAYDPQKHDKALEVLSRLYKPDLAGSPAC